MTRTRDRWGFFYTEAIFNYLKLVAERRDYVWYSDIADDIGGNRRNLGARELAAIWRVCEGRGWPHLNALVLSVVTKLPGQLYTPHGKPVTTNEYEQMTQEIYDFDWTDKHL